jgi:hypothetical protein
MVLQRPRVQGRAVGHRVRLAEGEPAAEAACGPARSHPPEAPASTYSTTNPSLWRNRVLRPTGVGFIGSSCSARASLSTSRIGSSASTLIVRRVASNGARFSGAPAMIRTESREEETAAPVRAPDKRTASFPRHRAGPGKRAGAIECVRLDEYSRLGIDNHQSIPGLRRRRRLYAGALGWPWGRRRARFYKPNSSSERSEARHSK